MFESVGRKHFDWNCSVGGGSSGLKPKLHGMGCAIGVHHVLTARHCWTEISSNWDWPVALAFGALFRCSIAAEFAPDDIMLLQLDKQIAGNDPELPTSWPTLSRKPISWGASIGFMARIRFPGDSKKKSYAYLGAGVASILLPNAGSRRFVLTNALVQAGFSGSAAFRKDGSIVGVVVQSFTFFIDLANPLIPPLQLPVIAPIFPLVEELNAIISNSRDT